MWNKNIDGLNNSATAFESIMDNDTISRMTTTNDIKTKRKKIVQN